MNKKNNNKRNNKKKNVKNVPLQKQKQKSIKTKKRGGRRMREVKMPVQLTNVVQTYSRLTANGGESCIPIPNELTSMSQFMCVPVHPLFYSGRVSELALRFLRFTVTKATLIYTPVQGTGALGMLYMSTLPNTNTISQNILGGKTILQMSEIGANVTPLWIPTSLSATFDGKKRNTFSNLIGEFPGNFFVSSTDNVHTLDWAGQFFLKVSYKFDTAGNNGDDAVPYGLSPVYTLSAGGITCPIATDTVIMIVSSSTVIGIDFGELVVIPPITTEGVAANLAVLHNGDVVNYGSLNFRGDIQGMCYSRN